MTLTSQPDRSPAPGIIPEPAHVQHDEGPSAARKRQEPDVAAPEWQADEYPGTSDPGAMLSGAERLTAERTQRRRQRAVTRDAPITRQPRGWRRRERPTESQSALRPPRRLNLRYAVSVTLIAVLAAGGALGAALRAVDSPGWVIGLLAAGLTMVLSATIQRYSRST